MAWFAQSLTTAELPEMLYIESYIAETALVR